MTTGLDNIALVAHNGLDPIPESLKKIWAQRLQRRVMRLLLLHDQRLFRGQFRTFYTGSDLPHLPIFAQYDRFLALRTLSDELFDDIMPRVRRQLSLQTDQARLIEGAPTRGDIDWPRTIQRGWRETPGLPPIIFETRLRQRSTATPENLFTVAVLQAYRKLLRRFLIEAFDDEALSEEERQTLAANDEQAERELAAAYARALINLASQSDLAVLADQVERRLRPGPNPYRDLIYWWRRFSALQIGRGMDRRGPTLVAIRDDEKADAWLYELWIMLEFVHLLDEYNALEPAQISVHVNQLHAIFGWGGQHLRITYNRQVDGAYGSDPGWQNGPGVRPDYTIERVNPLKVEHQGTLIWREPPVVLDAKYYLSGRDPERTHAPIKKLLGDMALLDAAQCILFFPSLPEPASGHQASRIIERRMERHHGGASVSSQIQLYHLDPLMPIEGIQERLHSALEHATAHLSMRPDTIRCHGVCLDVDTMSPSHHMIRADIQILCPKPHIGPSVYDLVNRATDCLTNPRLCHIIGQEIIPPFVIRVTSQHELQRQTQELRDQSDTMLSRLEANRDQQTSAQAEQLRSHIFTGIGRTVEQYVKLRGNTKAIEENLERWVFGPFWKDNQDWSLAPEAREMLKSGEYVWQEYAQSDGLEDWAAPAIQYCRALELELSRRFYMHRPKDFKLAKSGWTIGTPVHAITRRKQDGNARTNLAILFDLVELKHRRAFAKQLHRLIAVRETRNRLAHSQPLAKAEAQQLHTLILGSRTHPGILCWLAEHVKPAKAANPTTSP